MRKASFIFATLLFVLVSFQNTSTQVTKDDVEFEKAPKQEIYKTDRNDFEKMSFEVELNKTEYVLLEPIGIKFRFSNKTDQPQTSYTPNFLTDTSVKISHNNESWERALYNLSINSSVRFPAIFMPGKTIEANGILQPNFTNKFFAEPGKYRLQFFLSDRREGVEKISSSIFEVEIKQPAGIDKEAFSYLQKYIQNQLSSDLFYLDERKNGQDAARLERFVAKYSSSVYGEYAIYSLGNFYLFYDEMEKAKSEFEKLKNSSNNILADNAKISLNEIEINLKNKLPKN